MQHFYNIKTQLLLVLTVFLFSGSIIGQELAPCGSMHGPSKWLKQYQQNPQVFSPENDSLLYVPLSIHIVGTDNGTGYYSMKALLNAFCVLNEDFADANIQFFIEGDINYVNNSAWYNHATVVEGAEMMFANNIDSTINCYFLEDPAGNCGYNLPYAGMVVAKSCGGANDHTWSHEMGHGLSLPHPFFGWEGGVGHDGSIDHNFSDPAPTHVLADYTFFKDTLILDTMIIDTVLVELVDGSNCAEAADGFCDTAPDYLAYRWSCSDPDNPFSIEQQTDPNGEVFTSDGSLIMSYAADECAMRFSDEQIAAMRANLYEEKAEVLYNQTAPTPLAANMTNIIQPVADDVVQYNDVTLEWDAIDGVDGYIVELTILPSFPYSLTTFITTSSNSVHLTDLTNETNYYWKVRPFSYYDGCTLFTTVHQFSTSDFVNTSDVDSDFNVVLFPTVVSSGEPIELKWNSAIDRGELNVDVIATTGQTLSSSSVLSGQGELTFNADLAKGVYFLQIRTAEGVQTTKRFVVQ